MNIHEIYEGSAKHILSPRENELETLRRKRGLTAQAIFDTIRTDNPSLRDPIEVQELVWMWQRDRDELKALKRQTQ